MYCLTESTAPPFPESWKIPAPSKPAMKPEPLKTLNGLSTIDSTLQNHPAPSRGRGRTEERAQPAATDGARLGFVHFRAVAVEEKVYGSLEDSSILFVLWCSQRFWLRGGGLWRGAGFGGIAAVLFLFLSISLRPLRENFVSLDCEGKLQRLHQTPKTELQTTPPYSIQRYIHSQPNPEPANFNPKPLQPEA